MKNYNIKIYNSSLNSNIQLTIKKSTKRKALIVFHENHFWSGYIRTLSEDEIVRLYNTFNAMNIEKMDSLSILPKDDVRLLRLMTNDVSLLSIYRELCKHISKG